MQPRDYWLHTPATHTHTHAHKGSTDASDALVVLCFEKSSCGLYGKDFGSRMPPSPGKKIKCMMSERVQMTMPRLMKPPSRPRPKPVGPMMYLDEMRAPVLPPAPTMPETTP